ncbi:hypothetical protein ACLOJK_004785 [Asimina triloba]
MTCLVSEGGGREEKEEWGLERKAFGSKGAKAKGVEGILLFEEEAQFNNVPISLDEAPCCSKRAAVQRAHVGILFSVRAIESTKGSGVSKVGPSGSEAPVPQGSFIWQSASKPKEVLPLFDSSSAHMLNRHLPMGDTERNQYREVICLQVALAPYARRDF